MKINSLRVVRNFLLNLIQNIYEHLTYHSKKPCFTFLASNLFHGTHKESNSRKKKKKCKKIEKQKGLNLFSRDIQVECEVGPRY